METPGESASAYAAARSSGGGGQEAAKKEGKRRFSEYFRRKSRSDKAKLVEAIAVVEAFDVCGEPIGTRARRRRGSRSRRRATHGTCSGTTTAR